MSPLRSPRVVIIEHQEKGWLNKMMPQGDGSYLYEIYGDSGALYIIAEEKFYYIDEAVNESEW
jgi:hypothetical protein